MEVDTRVGGNLEHNIKNEMRQKGPVAQLG